MIDWPDRLGNVIEEHPEYWALSTQIPAYENAIKFRACHKTKWLILLDTDEYLVPIEKNTLAELLEKYNEYPGISLSREFINASITDTSSPKKLLIQNVSLINPPKINLFKAVTKTIFKPTLTEGFGWPPYEPLFKNQQKAKVIGSYEMKINQYLNRGKKRLDSGRPILYRNNRSISEEELSDLIERGYEVEDSEPVIQRYVPQLLKKIELGNK